MAYTNKYFGIYSLNIQQTIVKNLRENHPELHKYTDTQILAAWDNWSLSEDSPNEKKILDWINVI